MHAHAHAQARTRGKKSQREQQVLNFDAVEKNWHPEFLMKYRWKEIVFDGDGGRKIVGDWKWYFGGPCTLELLTGGIQCWYRMMVLNESIKRGWSRTKLVLLVLFSSQLRFWIFSEQPTYACLDWLLNWSSAAKWAWLLITYLVAALSNSPKI